MKNYLLIDFGSTNTKLTAVDVEAKKILARAKAVTTVETNIIDGFEEAYKKLIADYGPIEFTKKIACSSAAGGLKMAAIGLVEELTVEAAKRACFGAGAKVDLVFSFFITKNDVALIKAKKIDIILLAGGTDGGNTASVLANAKLLASSQINIPIIYAGNKACQDEIREIFSKTQTEVYIVNNIMPKLNELKIEESQETIRKIFLKNIIEAKGIKQIEALIDEVIFPTPQAVLKATTLLAKGYLDDAGLGDILIFDIGGATTDVYSIASGMPSRADVILKGLEEPFAKRTVEGDLGMRYSAFGIIASLSEEELKRYKQASYDLDAATKFRYENIEFVSESKEEQDIDRILAGLALDQALSRHVGRIDSVHTPLGLMYYQTGKDLSNVKAIIGTGGIVINDTNPLAILNKAKESPDKPLELRPKHPEVMLDKNYILSAMGLLALDEPEAALTIMKENIIKM